MFRVTFRKEFTLLKQSFFKHIDTKTSDVIAPGSLATYLKVPLLLMTATLNQELIKILQMMIEIRVALGEISK